MNPQELRQQVQALEDSVESMRSWIQIKQSVLDAYAWKIEDLRSQLRKRKWSRGSAPNLKEELHHAQIRYSSLEESLMAEQQVLTEQQKILEEYYQTKTLAKTNVVVAHNRFRSDAPPLTQSDRPVEPTAPQSPESNGTPLPLLSSLEYLFESDRNQIPSPSVSHDGMALDSMDYWVQNPPVLAEDPVVAVPPISPVVSADSDPISHWTWEDPSAMTQEAVETAKPFVAALENLDFMPLDEQPLADHDFFLAPIDDAKTDGSDPHSFTASADNEEKTDVTQPDLRLPTLSFPLEDSAPSPGNHPIEDPVATDLVERVLMEADPMTSPTPHPSSTPSFQPVSSHLAPVAPLPQSAPLPESSKALPDEATQPIVASFEPKGISADSTLPPQTQDLAPSQQQSSWESPQSGNSSQVSLPLETPHLQSFEREIPKMEIPETEVANLELFELDLSDLKLLDLNHSTWDSPDPKISQMAASPVVLPAIHALNPEIADLKAADPTPVGEWSDFIASQSEIFDLDVSTLGILDSTPMPEADASNSEQSGDVPTLLLQDFPKRKAAQSANLCANKLLETQNQLNHLEQEVRKSSAWIGQQQEELAAYDWTIRDLRDRLKVDSLSLRSTTAIRQELDYVLQQHNALELSIHLQRQKLAKLTRQLDDVYETAARLQRLQRLEAEIVATSTWIQQQKEEMDGCSWTIQDLRDRLKRSMGNSRSTSAIRQELDYALEQYVSLEDSLQQQQKKLAEQQHQLDEYYTDI